MELQCDAGEKLFVLDAVYGAYDSFCDPDTCCEPDQTYDCTESIVTEDPETWNLVRIDCNYKESCLFQYQGSALVACGVAIADYMKMTYSCSSGQYPFPLSISTYPLNVFSLHAPGIYLSL